MAQKMDRRKMRTKRLIRQSVLHLIAEKKVKNITVSDITSHADINRGTFYLHYKDVDDLLEQYQLEILTELKDKVRHINLFDFIKYKEKEGSYPVLIGVLEAIAKHADLLSVLLGPNGDPGFSLKLKAFVKGRILEKLSTTQINQKKMMVPPEYFATFIASAHLGIIQHWIETGMQRPPKEIASIITQIAVRGPLATLRLDERS